MQTSAQCCPAWCSLPAGHDQDTEACDPVDGARFVRHRAHSGGEVAVEQLVIDGPDGAETFAPVVIIGDRERTVADALRLALDLTAALAVAVTLR